MKWFSKNRREKIFLVVISLILALVISEFLFRFYMPQSPYQYKDSRGFTKALSLREHPLYPGYKGPALAQYFYTYKSMAVWSHEYPDNPDGYFTNNNQVHYRMNTDGFRDYGFGEKKADVFRILCIGDSYTFGEGVHQPDTFPKILERMLRENNVRAEVFNLGIPGYGIRDEVTLLGPVLSRYMPDMVIWGFTPNDISHKQISQWVEKWEDDYSDEAPETFSHLANHLLKRLRKARQAQDYKFLLLKLYETRPYWDEFRLLFQHARDRIQKRKASMVLVVLPDLNMLKAHSHAFSPIHFKINILCQNLGVGFVDVTGDFLELGPENLWAHPTDSHYNRKGHGLVAKALLPVVIKEIQGRDAIPADPQTDDSQKASRSP